MSIEDQSVVDVIGVANDGTVVLTISNHLEWSESSLFLLQEKINKYLAFIESGEIYSSYPNAKGKNVEISVVCKHKPSSDALQFLEQCTRIISAAGFGFRHEVLI
ncbi:DUF6572 domain-containing protein [Microbulbifer hydrolyticus]|uniref:Uncharacterized protein n=2 Tax=Microbulbifer hydrolyticus TaxID=48074 RepID=A0A6P1TI86_9GAMM|nr:DUF6572 domain-containing protein [Microbulbifer hydrolyticus]MBB5212556.1 hypothetical protein [Microbulbifer hydrolyticus]QHQ40909.1 hypothetical protein GTQ55_15095 [Microbulbifer hydrolyticus]